MHPSPEKLDGIKDVIDHQILDYEPMINIPEEFLSRILKTVDELCDDIKNGDPDIERMLEVNLNLNNAVSCYKSMVSLRKQKFTQKKKQEFVNHKTREIIQPYQYDHIYNDCDPKDIDGQIINGSENFDQTDNKDPTGAENNRLKESDYKSFENWQSISEETRESKITKKYSDLSEEVLDSRNPDELKRLKKEIVVNCDEKKLEAEPENRLFNSEGNSFYDVEIEKKSKYNDQMINQNSVNVNTEQLFYCNDKVTNRLAKEKHKEVESNEKENQVPVNDCKKRLESDYKMVDKGIGYKPKLNEFELSDKNANRETVNKKEYAKLDQLAQSYPYLKFDYDKGMFLCSICNHLSNNRFNSLRHIARNHKKEIRSDTAALSNMVAADCGKSFCRKLYGSQGKTFWCKECTRFFSNLAKLPRKKSKIIWKKELCQECGKNVTNLKHHILRMHTVENVKCSNCEKVFRNAELLKRHTDNVHEKVPCVHCGKFFGATSNMRAHIQSQHTSNEDKKHKCDVCGKGFFDSNKLKDHGNIHTGEKPYNCKFCSSAFASRGTHAMHERSHLGRGRKYTKK